jgi:ribosomal protein L21
MALVIIINNAIVTLGGVNIQVSLGKRVTVPRLHVAADAVVRLRVVILSEVAVREANDNAVEGSLSP